MGRDEAYRKIVTELGDLARELLVERPDCPRSMERVFKAEQAVLERRDELAALEDELDGEEEAYKQFLVDQKAERLKQEAIAKRFQKTVDAIQGRTRDLHKRLIAQKAAIRYDKASFAKAEERYADLELTSGDEYKLDEARILLKRLRLAVMKRERDYEDLQRDFEKMLSPEETSKGAPGIMAHRRMLEMEDEAIERKEEHEAKMVELDQLITEKDTEVSQAEDFLEQAIFLAGEECYQSRVKAGSEFEALYKKIDKVA